MIAVMQFGIPFNQTIILKNKYWIKSRVSNIEIAKIVFKIMKQQNLTKLKKNNFLKNVSDRPGHDKRYALDTTFFKKNINYRMKFNLSLGLKITIEWYIKNENGLKARKSHTILKGLDYFD